MREMQLMEQERDRGGGMKYECELNRDVNCLQARKD